MNYKKKKFKISYLIIIVVALVVLLLFSFVIKDNGKLTFIQKVFKDVSTTTVNVLKVPIDFINDKSREKKKMKEVYKNYKNLQENTETIDLIKAENESLKKEIGKLKEVNSIEESLTEYTYIPASIVKRNINYWNNTVTINKGSKSGIEDGMVVIENGGMIGVTTNVAYYSSDVKLITSFEITPKISVEVRDSNKSIPGLLSKYNDDKNTFTIEGVSEYNNIEIGSYVYTTAYNEKIPAGVLVGKVVSIEKDNYDLTKIIEINSGVDFDNLRYVKVLKKGE